MTVSKNKKIKDAIFFSPMGGHIGVVLYENEVGERKVYIKAVSGLDQAQDEQEIADYGAKVPEEVLNTLLTFLREAKKST